MTTPADELRQAAATIRDVAAKASPGPWRIGNADEINAEDGHLVANVNWWCTEHPGRGDGDSAHVAMWHPGIACLVADLLDGIGHHWASRPEEDHSTFDGLTIAELVRAINGGAE